MHKRMIALSLVVVACIVFSMSIVVQNDKNMIQSFADEHSINAYSIAFYNGAKPLEFMNTNGITEDTVYEVGSNGKIIVAYIALKLVDEGKISLDTKIYPFLKAEFITDDVRLQKITVGQLLSHTGGFSPSYELGIDKKIYFEPGTRFQYSGVGYIYLQSVIENITGLSIEELAKEYVFTPLGMNYSTFESTTTVTPYMRSSSAVLYCLLVFLVSLLALLVVGVILKRMIKGKEISLRLIFLIVFTASSVINLIFLLIYFVSKVAVLFVIYACVAIFILFLTRKKPKLMYIGFSGYTILFIVLGLLLNITIPVTNDLVPREANAAYSLKSTSHDMALFCQELLEKSSDHDSAVQDMFLPAVVIDDQNSWGLGIAIENTAQGLTYWHSGINPGFQSLVVLYPSNNSYIVILTNSDDGLGFAKKTSTVLLNIDGTWDIKR